MNFELCVLLSSSRYIGRIGKIAGTWDLLGERSANPAEDTKATGVLIFDFSWMEVCLIFAYTANTLHVISLNWSNFTNSKKFWISLRMLGILE